VRTSDKVIVCIGVLDVASVLWAVIGAFMGGSGITMALSNLRQWGLPLPILLGIFGLLAYALILVCGVLLVLRQPKFSWLNYVLFPLRLAFFLPTLFPIFLLGGRLGLGMHPIVSISILVATEIACCVFIYFWWHSHPRRYAVDPVAR